MVCCMLFTIKKYIFLYRDFFYMINDFFKSKFQIFSNWIFFAFNFIKLNFFSVAYCDDSDPENSDSTDGNSENSSKPVHQINYFCSAHLINPPNEKSITAIDLGMEVMDSEGSHRMLRFVFRVHLEKLMYTPIISMGTIWYAKQLVTHIRSHSKIPLRFLIPIYVASALSTGIFYMGFANLVKFLASLEDLEQELKSNHPQIKAEIIREGSLENADLDSIYKFVTEAFANKGNSVSGLRRATTVEIEKGTLPGGVPMEVTEQTSEELMSLIHQTSTVSSEQEERSLIEKLNETVEKTACQIDSNLNTLESPTSEYLRKMNKYFDECLSPGLSPTERMTSIHIENARNAFSDSPVNPVENDVAGPSYALVPKNDDPGSPGTLFGDKSWGPPSALESADFNFLVDTIMTCSLVMLFISIVSQLWLRFSFLFPKLKQTKLSFLDKYGFLKKLNTYYDSLTVEQLRALRILYTSLSLYTSGGLFFLLVKFWFALKLFLNLKS